MDGAEELHQREKETGLVGDIIRVHPILSQISLLICIETTATVGAGLVI